MRDPRFHSLAKQLIEYSTQLKPNEKILIELTDVPEEIGIALLRQVRSIGAIPFLRLNSNKLQREMLSGATDAQYEIISQHLMKEMQDMDAYIAIRGGSNAFESSSVPAKNMELAMRHLSPVLQQRVNHTRWCGLRWPSEGLAQQAGMSTEEYEDFYFDVCLMDYGALKPAMEKLKVMMENTDIVHIVDDHTDIQFSIKGMPAIPCAGEYNIPDGEVFTAPHKESVNGYITYNCPTVYQGIPFDNVSFVVKNGKIVEAQAGNQTEQLNTILDSDEGARYFGEFAIGVNPIINKPIRNILFDEKIGGSFHLTPGQAYSVVPNGNDSQVHWDLVHIQTEAFGGGKIFFDGKLIRENGLFLDEELAILNPQH